MLNLKLNKNYIQNYLQSTDTISKSNMIFFFLYKFLIINHYNLTFIIYTYIYKYLYKYILLWNMCLALAYINYNIYIIFRRCMGYDYCNYYVKHIIIYLKEQVTQTICIYYIQHVVCVGRKIYYILWGIQKITRH